MHNWRIIFRFLEGSDIFSVFQKENMQLPDDRIKDIDIRFFNRVEVFGLKLIVKISRH